MGNFILGFLLSPIVVVLFFLIYLHFAKRRRDVKMREAIREYNKDEYKDYVGEFPAMPARARYENEKNTKKDKV